MGQIHATLNHHRWAAVRRFVFERDGWRCTSCGKAGRLECDHVTPLERDPKQDPYAIDGLQSLCRGCHIEKTRTERAPRERTASERAWHALVAEMMD